jgi:molecular chaperone GrpE
MDPLHEIEDQEVVIIDSDTDESMSVDEFIRELEAKEKDLHITSDANVIEIEDTFDDANPSEFVKAIEPVPAIESLDPEVGVLYSVSESEIGVDEPSIDESLFEAELGQLKKRIETLEAERNEMIEASHRRARDFESFKTRTNRERNDLVANHVSDLVTQLLPAIDNLDRALAFAASLPREKSAEFQQFFDGIELVGRQLSEILAEMGVMPIPALGEEFDPTLHEAVATEEGADLPANTICEVLLKGYSLGDRVIRHSMVKVSVLPASQAEPEVDAGIPELERFGDEATEDPS